MRDIAREGRALPESATRCTVVEPSAKECGVEVGVACETEGVVERPRGQQEWEEVVGRTEGVVGGDFQSNLFENGGWEMVKDWWHGGGRGRG